ncbi:hypothetical protein AUK11_03585 [bacterium CG2_30_37_16]|nr:MAG: hypothetical protein AUK11_03585 [bacterium CG2_30_37_16]PIP30772.1 MAG: Holliday junction resolvase RuvX [bacterium (Candidatus Howlettbacteria) CG23_combo_of_CG06-09_8_20_14_all_37_9]PIX98599.1 MAG: Holliday junction resolvase RuvX [bacterium (Candidatus Howlettbacteria) CG_4_10_14_3_um_filter_37_10]PJB05178.1 MAG: Holliday junction resolvase RuvX [bacterium (Candidatus Howlettbacteria) CG_4_9_14_3_um_filter_37_10]
MRLLAVDVGEKRIGLAITDPTNTIATEHSVVSPDQFKDKLQELVKTEGVDTIVVGRPRNLNGDLGPQAKRIEDFISKEVVGINIEIIWEDESLTSKMAEEELKQKGFSNQDLKEKVDMVAARIILESYLRRI